MNIVIDRFEGNFAVVELEGKQFANMPKELIPPKAKEGDVITIQVDTEETQRRKADVSKLMGTVWKD